MADNDLKVFVDACRVFKQPISIRGSTAYVLSRNPDPDSLTESVPPLGDLDLVVRDKKPAESMRRVGDVLERYRTYVPASRFIHVDVFYEHLPVRGDSPIGNVVINGLPEVAIGPDKRQDSDWKPNPSSPDQQVQAKVTLKVQATLFRDFLYLLRLSQRHKELEKATWEVAKLLRSQRPSTIGLVTREEGGVRELARINKALVKHVLLRDTEDANRPMTEYLSANWLHRFASHLNDLSKRIILSEEYWKRTRVMAYAVEGRVRQFMEVTDLDEEEKKVLKKKLEPEEESILERLTPSLKVALPNPDNPNCCEYFDFSKGISELVFRDPAGGSLLDMALMEGREKYFAVHAQASAGFGARSLRTDPGFMSMLNHGSLGGVRLMGVRSQ